MVTGQQPERFDLPEDASIEVVPSIGYTSKQRLAELAPRDGARDAGNDSSFGGRQRGTNSSLGGPVGRVSNSDVAAGTAELAKRIAGELFLRFGGSESVWWVHNHHLGKNPAFTKALVDITTSHPAQPIVLHIHDFPECGRYDNLRLLEIAGVADRYPRGPHVTYVTINSRDKRILRDAGIGDAVYLPNPVSVGKPGEPSDVTGVTDATERNSSTRTKLFDNYGVEFPRFDPEARLFLYPVRSIRRKNIFEAALLTMLQEEPSTLVVTLPGVSQSEKKYSAMVEHAFHDGTIPGLFGIGTTIEKNGIAFSDVMESADAIMSSSVQEGFGYQYVSPLLLGKPLVARQLDIMDDVLPLFADHPHAFYTSVTVPIPTPSLSGPQPLLRFRYEERIDRLATSLPETVIEELYRRLEEVLSSSTVEFSFLLPHMQYVILQDIRRDAGYREAFRRANTTVIDQIDRAVAATSAPAAPPSATESRRSEATSQPSPALSTPAPAHPSRATTTSKISEVDAAFGLAAHAKNIVSILDRTHQHRKIPHIDPAAILRRFATLEYQRVLYE